MSELTVQYQETETEKPPVPVTSYTQFNRSAIRTPEFEKTIQAAVAATEYKIYVLQRRLHVIDVDMAVAMALVYVDERERQTRIFYYNHYMDTLRRQLALKTEYIVLLTELLEKKPRTELQQASLLARKVRMDLQFSEQAKHVKDANNTAISANEIDMVLPGYIIQLKNKRLVQACEIEQERERRRVRPGASY